MFMLSKYIYVAAIITNPDKPKNTVITFFLGWTFQIKETKCSHFKPFLTKHVINQKVKRFDFFIWFLGIKLKFSPVEHFK